MTVLAVALRGRRKLWLAAVAVVVTASVVAATLLQGSREPTPSRSAWLAKTRAILLDGMHLENSAPFLVLPSAGGSDIYSSSLAMVGLATAAPKAVDPMRAVVQKRMRTSLSADELEKSIAGPLFTAREIVRANAVAHVLDDQDLVRLHAVLDSTIARPTDSDAFDIAYAVELATALHYREQQVRSWAAAALRRNGTAACTGSDALYQLGAATAVPGYLDPCSGVADIWTRGMQALETALANGDRPVGLEETEQLLALTRLWKSTGADEPRRRRLVAAVDHFQAALAAVKLADVTPAVADVRTAADELGTPFTLPPVAAAYLTSVVQGGADAQTVTLDPDSLALVARTYRLLGGSLDVPSDVRAHAPVTGQLDLALARTDAGWTPEVSDLTGQVARKASSPLDESVLVRALAVAGPDACSQKDALSVAHRVIGAVGSERGHSGGRSLATLALAVRALQQCAPGADVTAARNRLLSQSAATLAKTRNAAARPTLMEAWDAVAVTCALDSSKTPSATKLWTTYADQAAPPGGALDDSGAGIDLTRTFALVSMVELAPSRCRATGTLG